MNLKSLRIFALIMEHGTLARASEMLHLSPPAVSRLLRLLEEELGEPLFDRVKKRLISTPAGERLYPEALRLLAGLDGMADFLDQTRGVQQANLRVVCHTRAVRGLMLPAITLLSRRCHEARVRFEVQPRNTFGGLIAQDQFHLGVGSLPTPLESVKTEPLCESALCVLLPVSHRLANRRELLLHDLRSEPYIALTETTLVRQLVDGELIKSNTMLQPVHEVSMSAAAHQLVADGLGYTITDRIALGPEPPPDLKLVPLKPKIMLKFGIFRSSTDRRHPLADVMIECLRSVAADITAL